MSMVALMPLITRRFYIPTSQRTRRRKMPLLF
jgi:hypothetical protein